MNEQLNGWILCIKNIYVREIFVHVLQSTLSTIYRYTDDDYVYYNPNLTIPDTTAKVTLQVGAMHDLITPKELSG